MRLSDPIEIRRLGPDDLDLMMSAQGLFDFAPLPDQSEAFLSSDREFMWFAMDGETPVGFVSASVILHPDKKPQFFVNELATHERHRRRGIATALMASVVSYSRNAGFWPIWLAAEVDDEQAKAFYRSLRRPSERGAVIFEWE